MTRAQRPKIEGFTIFQENDGHGQIFVQLGPRYLQPQDDTTVLVVGHKTVDPQGISVLLEQADFESLRVAMAYPLTAWTLHDGQTSARFFHGTDTLPPALAIWWNGSGRSRTFTFNHVQVRDMRGWMDERLRDGWTGWKSGVRS